MCDLCRMNPCHPLCPNAPDPPAVTTCYRCGEPIVPGDEYAHIDGIDYCENCFDDMPYCELVLLLGGEWKTVQKGEKVVCSFNGEEIPEGEDYGVLGNDVLCEECMGEMPYCDLVEMGCGEWRTAKEEDVYDGFDG